MPGRSGTTRRRRKRYDAKQLCFNGHVHRTVRAMRACHRRDTSWITRVEEPGA